MLDGLRTIHLIGIGGIGVSAVARVLNERGFSVRGSDVRESSVTEALRAEGVDVRIGHSASHLDGVDLVVQSTAIPATNPELIAAHERGLRVAHRSEVLGELLVGRESVGIIGTHGKGTVSAMIAWVLETAGRAPGFVIGGMPHNFGVNARDGRGPIVAEVDESDGSLVNVHPQWVVLNNLELDHLNYYPDWETLSSTVRRFFAENRELRAAVVNVDDEGVRRLLPLLDGVTPITAGLRPEARYRGTDARTEGMVSRVSVALDGKPLGELTLRVPGLYNVHNALTAAATCHAMGVPFEDVARGLATFDGLENRFTLVAAGGVQVVKDYISHPTGIQRVLEAAREIAPGRITAVFKPYRFTMIHYLQDQYRECFRQADHVVVTELYTAGEVPIPGVDAPWLCDKVRESGTEVTFVPAMEDIVHWLQARIGEGEQVIFFGGDDLFRLADAYVDWLRAPR